ncbi:DUF1624 domain-containing protein [Chondromyces crocatus]|uniref:Heparan-alpha-glucosaminide N-acetyltransferase catalytic domain-containing protein n=1 Tax=Chondromyces crocatus TaxID=52 RepID=A0A0K1EL58_CHOCO|nr:heparan-alpha-glucosaminide N-acetyltransferase domain-containing protein [Chondromyces crocatus]AKT41609.1 uncharacterized protein CMC5_058160 [Chondromyces crocatus]
MATASPLAKTPQQADAPPPQSELPRPADAVSMVVRPAQGIAAAGASRLVPLDWMRGLVMVLMTIDHASGAFNANRISSDSSASWKVGSALPLDQFLTRWITHLCAPTFIFLAGAVLALSVERRLAKGEAPGKVDRFILTRGLIIVLLDALWMSWAFVRPGAVLFQVLYAIGASMMCMALLRRLPTAWLVGGAAALMLGGEALTGLLLWATGEKPILPVALLFTGGRFPPLMIAYALVPWLSVMMLGWGFGRLLAKGEAVRPARWLALGGLGALSVFAVVRGLNGYGNMRLLRENGSLAHWLHVSKYPPSLSYLALELGIMALLLAGFFALARRAGSARWMRPLLVLGQTALFFYVLHVHLLQFAAWALGMSRKAGLGASYLASLGLLLLLYPLCVAYGRYKAAHPEGWARYL